jgi:HipA-like protein
MQKNSKKINAVDVYLKKRKTRQYVGRLSRDNSNFIFIYDNLYLYKNRSIALGPDLPLTKKKFTSKILFPSFADRIPSNKNPAYNEYCQMVGIDPTENDQIVLVATLGHKGPSSFIFSPALESTFTHDDVVNFRKYLSLTVREFGELFDFSPATISNIENKTISGKEAMKRLELYCNIPEADLYELNKNRFKINDEKVRNAEKRLLYKSKK